MFVILLLIMIVPNIMLRRELRGVDNRRQLEDCLVKHWYVVLSERYILAGLVTSPTEVQSLSNLRL